jgi:hypothetical protein
VLMGAGPFRLAPVILLGQAFFGYQEYACQNEHRKPSKADTSWRRLAGSRVTVNAYAPGFVPGTALTRDMPAAVRESYRLRTGRTPAEGADTAVWLASALELEGVSGGRASSSILLRPCDTCSSVLRSAFC